MSLEAELTETIANNFPHAFEMRFSLFDWLWNCYSCALLSSSPWTGNSYFGNIDHYYLIV